MNWLLESIGIKRYITAIINVVSTIMYLIPMAGPITAIVQAVGGILGGVGLTHAAIVKTELSKVEATKSTLASILSPNNLSAIFAVLLAIAEAVPQFNVAVPVLQALAALFGITVVAKSAIKK